MTNGFWDQATAMGTPTPDSYKQIARDQHISRGSTTAIALPQSLPGFMVGRSTLEGAPVGWDGGKGTGMRMNIDPDISGEGFSVDMDDVKSAAFQQAAASARVRQAVSIDDLRERASAVYRSFARGPVTASTRGGENVPEYAQAGNPGLLPPAMTPPPQAPPPPPPLAPFQQPQQPLQQPLQQPPQPARPVATEPNMAAGPFKAAAFAQPAPLQAPPAASAPAASLFDRVAPPPVATGPARVARVAGSAPTYRVTFEVKGAPMVTESWYHDIIRDEHVLVLIYDTSCTGYPRSRLQPTDNDICVHIEGSDVIYLVQDPLIAFEFGSQEFQILLIKAEHPFDGVATTE